jgi:hypothetical protein
VEDVVFMDCLATEFRSPVLGRLVAGEDAPPASATAGAVAPTEEAR